MLHPFDHPMARTVHENLHAQAERAVAVGQEAVDLHLDLARETDERLRSQALANGRAAMEAWQAGARMVMDAQRAAVGALAPETETAEA